MVGWLMAIPSQYVSRVNGWWWSGLRLRRNMPAAQVVWLGPTAADDAVGGVHVVTCGLHLLAVLVGLFVDGLEVAAQLGDELLAGHRTRTALEVAGGQHIAHDGLVLGLQ